MCDTNINESKSDNIDLVFKYNSFRSAMKLSSRVLTIVIVLIVAMQGFSPKCKNIKEYSTAGLAARTRSPICAEDHPNQKVSYLHLPASLCSPTLFLLKSWIQISECIDNSSERTTGKPSLQLFPDGISAGTL